MGYTETLEGFFFTDKTKDYPYLIIRSGNFLLPDCHNLPLADLDYEISKNVFWEALAKEREATDDEVYRQEIDQWTRAIEKLEAQKSPLRFSLRFLKRAFGETKPIIPPKTKSKKSPKSRGMGDGYGLKLNAFIGRITNGRYFFTTRKITDLDALGLSGYLKGHFCMIPRPIIHEDEVTEIRNALAYVAGYKLGAQYGIARASIIRMIMSSEEGGRLPESLRQEYFAQLMVDHIRTSFYTVKPFPFKYLREFSRYYNALHKIKIDLPIDDDEDDTGEGENEDKVISPEEDALVEEELSLF